MLRSERQDEIVREVSRRGTASVAELAAHLAVSEITVRRDLDALGALGRLERVRGGARHLLPQDPEPPVVQRELAQAEEKRAIGHTAAGLVHDGDMVAITAGSTTLELARAVAARPWRNLQVVTNSFTVASELMRTPGVRLTFVGGRVNADEMGTFGILAEEALKRMNIDRVFLGCRGIDAQTGLSNDEQSEKAMDRAFAAASRQVAVLADHSKFGQVFLIRIIPIADIDVIVTDGATPQDAVQELRQRGVQVTIASVHSSATFPSSESDGSPAGVGSTD